MKLNHDKSGFKKAWIVFAFGRSEEGYTFYELKDPSVTPFDKQQEELGIMASSVARRRVFSSKLFKHQSCGAIFEVELSEGQISYTRDQRPVAHWFNRDDRTAWKLRQATMDGMAKAKKEGSRNDLYELLEPIREEYLKTGSRDEKRLLISEVLRIITSGSV